MAKRPRKLVNPKGFPAQSILQYAKGSAVKKKLKAALVARRQDIVDYFHARRARNPNLREMHFVVYEDAKGVGHYMAPGGTVSRNAILAVVRVSLVSMPQVIIPAHTRTVVETRFDITAATIANLRKVRFNVL